MSNPDRSNASINASCVRRWQELPFFLSNTIVRIKDKAPGVMSTVGPICYCLWAGVDVGVVGDYARGFYEESKTFPISCNTFSKGFLKKLVEWSHISSYTDRPITARKKKLDKKMKTFLFSFFLSFFFFFKWCSYFHVFFLLFVYAFSFCCFVSFVVVFFSLFFFFFGTLHACLTFHFFRLDHAPESSNEQRSDRSKSNNLSCCAFVLNDSSFFELLARQSQEPVPLEHRLVYLCRALVASLFRAGWGAGMLLSQFLGSHQLGGAR